MPVRIIRRGVVPEPAAPQTEDDEHQVVEAAPTRKSEGAVSHLRGWEIGDCMVLRKPDLFPENGRRKFLVHRLKLVWYLLREFFEDERKVALTAQSGIAINAKIDHTFYTNYVVVVTPEDVQQPSDDVLAFVSKQLPNLVQSSAQEH